MEKEATRKGQHTGGGRPYNLDAANGADPHRQKADHSPSNTVSGAMRCEAIRLPLTKPNGSLQPDILLRASGAGRIKQKCRSADGCRNAKRCGNRGLPIAVLHLRGQRLVWGPRFGEEREAVNECCCARAHHLLAR